MNNTSVPPSFDSDNGTLGYDNAGNGTIHNSTVNGTWPAKTNLNRLAIGVVVAISGNIMISLALSVQKYAHNRLGEKGKYCLDKWWWLGMIMMGIGEFGNFMAYGYAPASLVAPLGSVAVLFNVLIAFVFLHETMTSQSIMGVGLVISGSVFFVSFSASSHVQLNAETICTFLRAWTFLLYVVIEAAMLGVLLYFYTFRKSEHLLVLLLVVAIFASATIIAAKAVSTLLSNALSSGAEHILNPVFWIMLLVLPVSTAIQIRFLNRAMQLYNVSDVVPINFIFFTVSAILAGTVFYQEFYGVPFVRIFMFLLGCFLSFVGVYIISQKGRSVAKCNCLKDEKDSTLIPRARDVESVGDVTSSKSPDNISTSSAGRREVLLPGLLIPMKQTDTMPGARTTA